MAKKDTIVIPVTLLVESDGGGGGSGGTKSPEEQVLPTNKQDKAQKNAEEQALTVGKGAKIIAAQAAQKIASVALQNLGDITGNHVAGGNIQLAVSEGTRLVSGAVASAAAGGWVGLAVFAGTEVVNQGINAYNYVSQLKKSETQARFNQKRVFGTTIKS